VRSVRLAVAVSSFIAWTKFLYVDLSWYWDGWLSLGGDTTSICNQVNWVDSALHPSVFAKSSTSLNWLGWQRRECHISQVAGNTLLRLGLHFYDKAMIKDILLCVVLHCISKTDPDVAHYNFNAQPPILVIFGRDIAEWVYCQMMICCPTSLSLCLCTTWGNMHPRNGSFQSYCILSRKRLCFGLRYLHRLSTNSDNFCRQWSHIIRYSVQILFLV